MTAPGSTEWQFWEDLFELACESVARGSGPLISAQYAGRCPCGGRWAPGDCIAFSSDEDTWMHAECV